MSLLPVMRTVTEPFNAVVRRTATEKTVRQRFIPLLVPLKVPYHLLFLHKDTGVAGGGVAVKVFTVVELLTEGVRALGGVAVPEIK